MFGDFKNVRIYLKTGRIDFRKAVNVLSTLVEETMKLESTSGDFSFFATAAELKSRCCTMTETDSASGINGLRTTNFDGRKTLF